MQCGPTRDILCHWRCGSSTSAKRNRVTTLMSVFTCCRISSSLMRPRDRSSTISNLSSRLMCLAKCSAGWVFGPTCLPCAVSSDSPSRPNVHTPRKLNGTASSKSSSSTSHAMSSGILLMPYTTAPLSLGKAYPVLRPAWALYEATRRGRLVRSLSRSTPSSRRTSIARTR
jgi:hypothetical protein